MVGLVLRLLGVASSRYCDSRTPRREPSPRAVEDPEQLGLIGEACGEHEFAAQQGPAIVGADFNATRDHSAFRDLVRGASPQPLI